MGRAAKATLGAGAFEFGAQGFKMSGDMGGHGHLRGAGAEVGAVDVDDFVNPGEYDPEGEMGEEDGEAELDDELEDEIDFGEDIAA